MAPKGIVPGDPSAIFIKPYLVKKKSDYRTRRRQWYTNPEPYDFPPEVCMLIRLPTELVFMVIEDLYQADLYHLVVTCRRMAECTISTLYTRDITRFGCIALRWSCTFGIIPTLERTLQYGAPVGHIFHADSAVGCDWVIGGRDDNVWYFNPLVTAIAADELQAVRVLLAHGADANAEGVDVELYGRRPGVRPGNPDIVQCLLDAGADPNQGLQGLYIPPGYMFLGSDGPTRDPVPQGPPILTPLFLAMQSQVPVETVQLLLDYGADPTILGKWAGGSRWTEKGKGPSGLSSYKSPLDMLLLPERSSPSWPWGLDWEKVTLLLTYGGVEYIGPPLSWRFHTRFRSHLFSKSYPFIYYHFDWPEIVRVTQLFIDKGVDLAKLTARFGVSPIQAVIEWAEVRSTVFSPADVIHVPDITFKMCELVSMMAEATLAGVELNHQRSTIVDTPIRMITWEIGNTPNTPGLYPDAAHQPTPLSYVCSPFKFLGGTRLIDILLRFGADINAANYEGVTALHLAVMFSTGVAVRLLVESGGGPVFSGLNVNAPDYRGWTPLHYACHFGFGTKQLEQVDAVRILIGHGANIHARTISGITPLLLAVWCSNSPLVGMLLDAGAGRDDMSVGPFGIVARTPYNPLVDYPSIVFEDAASAWHVDREHTVGNILGIRHLLSLHWGEVIDDDDDDAAKEAPAECLHAAARLYEACFVEIDRVTTNRLSDITSRTKHRAEAQKLKFGLFDLDVYVIDKFSCDAYESEYRVPWISRPHIRGRPYYR